MRLLRFGQKLAAALSEANYLVGDAAWNWAQNPTAQEFLTQVDGIIDPMDPMLVEFAAFVLNEFGPKEAGYIYGMIFYEVAETAAITAVTVGAGAALKAKLLPKFVNNVMKLPFLAGNAKVAKEVDELVARLLRTGTKYCDAASEARCWGRPFDRRTFAVARRLTNELGIATDGTFFGKIQRALTPDELIALSEKYNKEYGQLLLRTQDGRKHWILRSGDVHSVNLRIQEAGLDGVILKRMHTHANGHAILQ